MSLSYLNSREFFVQPGKRGHVLCNRVKGMSLVLFYSDSCRHCHSIKPIFKELQKYVPSCVIALHNIQDDGMAVSIMSQQTIAPIKYVPYIVLYINGRPFMRYDGPSTIRDLTN